MPAYGVLNACQAHKVSTHSSSYRGGAKFGTWLTRITLDEAYGRMRKNKRQFSGLEGGDSSSVSPSDPEDEAYRSELATLLAV